MRLIEGDCLEAMAAMPEGSVSLIVADPPYFKVKNEWWDRQWDNPAGFLAWMGTLCEAFRRVLKPNGSLYLFASPKMAARVECKVGEWFNVLNRVTWRKPPFSTKAEMFDKDTLRAFFPSSEAIIFAEHFGADNMAKGEEAGYGAKCDELRGFVFEPLRAYIAGECVRAGVDTQRLKAAWMAYKGNKSEMPRHWIERKQFELPTEENYLWLRQTLSSLDHDYEYLRRDYEDLRRDYEDLRRPFSVTADVPYTDVWDFRTVPHRKGKHPCEKPLDMIRHIVRVSSRPGETVLDPFGGSGVTGEACLAEGRECILVEKDAGYFASMQRRIADAQNTTPLFQAEAS
jgi:adenine-specific DNA-methyltransferase